MSQEIEARRRPVIGDEMLRKIETFDDFFKLTQDEGILVENISIYGSGVVVLQDKAKLVGEPFVITGYTFNEGDNGPFVSATLIVRDPIRIGEGLHSKIVINDGSTGILKQLQSIEADRVANGQDIRPLYVGGGLRVSTYKTVVDGKETAASTYYLA